MHGELDQRYYNANWGRFWTVDPGGVSTADPANPMSWNRYAYANGDPVNYTDQQGLLAQSAESGTFSHIIGDPIGEPIPLPPEPAPVSDPVPPQRPNGPAPPPYAVALGNIEIAFSWIEDNFGTGTAVPECETDMMAAGTTIGELQAAAAVVQVQNGTT